MLSDLQEAMQKVKQLSGVVPICFRCTKNRDDKGYWEKIDQYIQDHSEAGSAMVFAHYLGYKGPVVSDSY